MKSLGVNILFILVLALSASDTCANTEMFSGLILKGQKLKRGDFPWIVALLYRHDIRTTKYFCGGSVISPALVISGKYEVKLVCKN